MKTETELLFILDKASDALSHASYCAIVGTVPNHGLITDAWDKLRDLIKERRPPERWSWQEEHKP